MYPILKNIKWADDFKTAELSIDLLKLFLAARIYDTDGEKSFICYKSCETRIKNIKSINHLLIKKNWNLLY